MNLQRRQQKMTVWGEIRGTTGARCKFWNQSVWTVTHTKTHSADADAVCCSSQHLYCHAGTHMLDAGGQETQTAQAHELPNALWGSERENRHQDFQKKLLRTKSHRFTFCNTYVPCGGQAEVYMSWSGQVDWSWHVLLHIFCAYLAPRSHLWSTSLRLCTISTNSTCEMDMSISSVVVKPWSILEECRVFSVCAG